MSLRRQAGQLALVLVVLVVLAGCGGSSSPTSTTSTGPSVDGAAADAVTIDSFTFVPATLTVSVGTNVTWTNDQSVSHTVTADDGSFDSGTLATGDTFSHTFDAAGSFEYHCTIHPSMTATVIVEA